MHTLTTIAAIVGITLLPGTTTVHAQNAVIEPTQATTTTEVAPNQFPLTPVSPEPTLPATTTATSTPEEEGPSTPTPTPTTTAPQPPKKNPPPAPKPVPKPAPKPVEEAATTTASTTPFIPLMLGTISPGNIYQNAIHAPLNAETTRGLLVLAGLSALLGSFMVEKRRLERIAQGISGLFSPPRSLPRPQAERQ